MNIQKKTLAQLSLPENCSLDEAREYLNQGFLTFKQALRRSGIGRISVEEKSRNAKIYADAISVTIFFDEDTEEKLKSCTFNLGLSRNTGIEELKFDFKSGNSHVIPFDSFRIKDCQSGLRLLRRIGTEYCKMLEGISQAEDTELLDFLSQFTKHM